MKTEFPEGLLTVGRLIEALKQYPETDAVGIVSLDNRTLANIKGIEMLRRREAGESAGVQGSTGDATLVYIEAVNLKK
jgi:hypothetical protein